MTFSHSHCFQPHSTKMKVAGFIRLPVQWFDDEQESYETRDFTLYCHEDGSFIKNYSLRSFWLSKIQPIYINSMTSPQLHDTYDIKSNPRRIHPFAHQYVHWIERVMLHVQTKGRMPPPLCIMKRCVLPASLRYRYRYVEQNTHYIEYEDCLPVLVRLQTWCRKCLLRHRSSRNLLAR